MKIDDYVNGNGSICREERQYALYLNNILLYYRIPEKRSGDDVRRIFRLCGLSGAEILNVFYEAAFMRDIRLAARENFNVNLVKHVTGLYPYNGKDYFLGGRNTGLLENLKKLARQKPDLTEEDIIKYAITVKSMMKSIPDLAVIFKLKNDDKKYLHFLECKYLSEESHDGAGSSQTEIQWKIAEFLCNKEYGLLTDLEISPWMDNNRACLVRFTKESPAPADKIPIADLITLNNQIFNIKITKEIVSG